MDIIALAILGILFGIQLFIQKSSDGHRRTFGILAFVFAVLLIFGWAGYLSWQQYVSWKGGEFTKFFLPPYQDFGYFIFFVRTRLFNPYILSLFFGLLSFFLAKVLNKKYQERFFEPIEPYFMAISIFLVGHPNWIFYLIFLLIANLTGNSYLTHKFYRSDKTNTTDRTYTPDKSDAPYRISFYYYWLPIAIFTILISKWLVELSWWQTLKF